MGVSATGCTCAVCSHEPETVRRSRRCKAAGAYLADMHTAPHVDFPVKLLPGGPARCSVPDTGEHMALPPVKRLGNELRTLALLALVILLVSSIWDTVKSLPLFA